MLGRVKRYSKWSSAKLAPTITARFPNLSVISCVVSSFKRQGCKPCNPCQILQNSFCSRRILRPQEIRGINNPLQPPAYLCGKLQGFTQGL
jgi:hypothetical protein